MKKIAGILLCLVVCSNNYAVSSQVEYNQVISKIVQNAIVESPEQKDKLVEAFITLKKAGVFAKAFKQLNPKTNDATYQKVMNNVYERAIKKAKSSGLGAAIYYAKIKSCRLPEDNLFGYSIKCLVATKDSHGGQQDKEVKVKITEQEFKVITK